MNIALLGPAFRSDQKEANVITLTTLAKYFLDQGHRAVLISNREGKLTAYEKMDSGVEIFRPHRWLDLPIGQGLNPLLIINQVLSPAQAVKTVQQKLGQRFDILHGFSAAPILAWREILGQHYAPKAKLVHSIKSHSQYAAGSYRWSKVLNRVDQVVVQNSQTREYLEAAGVHSDKIRIIKSHINTDKFMATENKAALKAKYGYTHGPVVLYYGHLLEVKGVNRLTEIFAGVVREIPTARLVIGWSGLGSLEKFQQHLRAQKIEGQTNIISDQIPIEDLVNLADVAVFPYPHLRSTEANPSCIIECVACRVPVVTSRLPELQELLIEDQQGLFANVGDTAGYVQQVVKILNQKDVGWTLTEHAYGILDQHRLDRIGEEHLQLYQSLLHA